MRAVSPHLHKGFTLVELVIVIIILSALGIMTTSYISTGVDIYSDIADRDKSLNSIRFVMERLRREVGDALPNSAFVSGACLTFTPIVASSVYTDFPISPDSASSGTISPLTDYDFSEDDQAVVYYLGDTELDESDRVQPIDSIECSDADDDSCNDTLNFARVTDISFPYASPAKRVYIINDNVSYYFSGTSLLRGSQCNSGVVMAGDISGSFVTSDATLQRNALVKATYILDFGDQEVSIEQALHINNTP